MYTCRLHQRFQHELQKCTVMEAILEDAVMFIVKFYTRYMPKKSTLLSFKTNKIFFNIKRKTTDYMQLVLYRGQPVWLFHADPISDIFFSISDDIRSDIF